MKLPVELKLLHPNFLNGVWESPTYATDGSAAFDLLAATDQPVYIAPFNTAFISTGLSIWIKDPSYVLLMVPRSGKGCKKGVVLGNSSGVIDSDYQGQLTACVYNRTLGPIVIEPGEYIAQAMLLYTAKADFSIVNEFSNNTIRGENGFGSTKQ
jgi:dUTP pyrophosphatase